MPTVLRPTGRVDGADFLTTNDVGVGLVAGVEELRWMTGGVLSLGAIDEGLWETFFFALLGLYFRLPLQGPVFVMQVQSR